jgi:1-acyl-sn-glycerol-3-phosphate acyltransferase
MNSFILQSEDAHLPFLGRLLKGLDPIFVKRQKADTQPCVTRMIQAIDAGKNLVLAPEGVVGPGRVVRRFHPALLESAVQTECPVHYASVAYRTPGGCPPPSKVSLFGPDPFYRTPDGKIPDSELEAWGPERSFLFHFLRFLSIPWREITFRFAPEPITGADRTVLPQELQDAVQGIFTPIA